jgi:hypothetical protein
VCIDVLYGDVLSRRRFVCAPKIGTPDYKKKVLLACKFLLYFLRGLASHCMQIPSE